MREVADNVDDLTALIDDPRLTENIEINQRRSSKEK